MSWWCLLWPLPYDVVMFSLIVYCVLIVVSALIWPSLFSLFPNDQRLSIGSLALLPSLALFLRILWDIEWLDWYAPIGMALCFGVIICLILRLRQTATTLGQTVVLIAVSSLISYGVIGYVNARFDNEQAETVGVTILDKSVAMPKSTSYQLYLHAWGNRTDGNFLSVPKSLHESLNSGDTVCILHHNGLLGLAWVEAKKCETLHDEDT